MYDAAIFHNIRIFCTTCLTFRNKNPNRHLTVHQISDAHDLTNCQLETPPAATVISTVPASYPDKEPLKHLPLS